MIKDRILSERFYRSTKLKERNLETQPVRVVVVDLNEFEFAPLGLDSTDQTAVLGYLRGRRILTRAEMINVKFAVKRDAEYAILDFDKGLAYLIYGSRGR